MGRQLSTLEDRDLVTKVVEGDVQAFEEIYDRYRDQAFALALRVTGHRRAAEEATQDAFLRLWRTSGSYDVNRGTLRAWLLSVVRNRSIDWLRSEARTVPTLEMDETLVEQLEAAERTDELVATREESRLARELLVSLPSEQRQVLELAFFKELTQIEIATKVGVPLGTVKGRQRLALRRLRRKLAGGPGLALST